MRALHPQGPILAGFAVAALALGGAIAAAGAHVQFGRPPAATVVTERALVFADAPDGGVLVADTAGHNLATFEGENGFLRGTLRSFGRDRHADGVDARAPLRFTRWSDGRLTVDDDATGRHVELSAFGPDNARVFAGLLYKEAAR